jgi:hypothetical protein
MAVVTFDQNVYPDPWQWFQEGVVFSGMARGRTFLVYQNNRIEFWTEGTEIQRNTATSTAFLQPVTMASTLDVTGNIDPTSYDTTNGGFKDEDDMASDSATAVASQQSIKKFVEDSITAEDLDFSADAGSNGSVDLDSQVFDLEGTTNQITTTSDGNQKVTFSTPQDIHTGASPTFANLSLGTGELTTGSINRASGSLTLEIGGSSEVVITTSSTTFGGTVLIPDNGWLGSASTNQSIQIENDGDVVFIGDITVTGNDIRDSGGVAITFDGSQNTTFAGNIIMADDKTIGLSSGGYIQFDDQTTDEINFIDCLIGMGTQTPSTFLAEMAKDNTDTTITLATETDYHLVIRNSDSSASTTGRFAGMMFKINTSSGDAAKACIYTEYAGSGDSDLVFATQEGATMAEAMRIDQAGKLGVGTTGPDTFQVEFAKANTDSTITLATETEYHLVIRNSDSTTSTAGRWAGMMFKVNTSSGGASNASIYSEYRASGSSDLVFAVENSNVVAEAMRIDQDKSITVGSNLSPSASDGGALGTTALEWSDLFLADGGIIYLGDDQDVTLTHVADTGILLNSTSQIQFQDSGTYIYSSADGVLDVVSDTTLNLKIGATAELALTATTATFGTNIVIPDAGNIGSASDTDAIAISSAGEVTFTQDIILTATKTIGATNAGGLQFDASNNASFSANLQIADAGTIGSASDADAIAIAAAGEVTFTQDIILTAAKTIGATNAGGLTFDASNNGTFSANLDVDGVFGVTATSSEAAINISKTFGDDTNEYDVNAQATFGTCTNATVLRSRINVGIGKTATNAYGVEVSHNTLGTITNLYGLYVNNMTEGDTLNYAIYTNSGICHFGDAVEITGNLTMEFGASQDYVIGNDSNNMLITSQTAATAAVMGLIPSDSDRTDNTYFRAYGWWSSAEREYLQMGWDAGDSAFEVGTVKEDAGSARALNIKTDDTTAINISTTQTSSFANHVYLSGDSRFVYFGAGNDMSIYYDGAAGNIDTDLVAASDLNIDCGTDKTVVLEETVWKDINLGAAVLSLPVASQPDEVQFTDEAGSATGIYSWGFAVGEKVSGNFELQHDYKEGTDLTFHIHWQGTTAPTGTDKVKWQLTYTVAQDEATLDAATTITVETDFDTQYEFKISNFAAITGTNFNIGDQFLFTLERIAASADEYGGDAIVATVGVHYQVDTIGSRQIGTK